MKKLLLLSCLFFGACEEKVNKHERNTKFVFLSGDSPYLFFCEKTWFNDRAGLGENCCFQAKECELSYNLYNVSNVLVER